MSLSTEFDESVCRQILIIEDNPDDYFFTIRHLKKHGLNFAHERVHTREAILKAIKPKADKAIATDWDLILCDYKLPGMTGMDVLTLLKNQGCDLPVILISGEIGEDTAVEAMRAGASDYVLKAQLHRLVPAIQRELLEYARRKQLFETKQLNEAMTAELIEARDRAVKLNHHKSNLLAFVAHEVKNPLKAIELFSEQLSVDIEALPDEQQAFAGEKLTYINEAINDARAILEDIVDIAKIESNTLSLHITRVPVDELFEQVLRSCQLGIVRKGMTVDTQNDGVSVVQGDALRLKQILVNLVGNAIKYSPTGTTITLSVTKKNEHVIFTVADEGHGISEDDQKHLFDEFYRVNNRYRQQTEGIGMGLALVKRLVECHQGEIGVQSRLGKGSTFTVSLPVELLSAV